MRFNQSKDWLIRQVARENAAEQISIIHPQSRHKSLLEKIDDTYGKATRAQRINIKLCYWYVFWIPTCVTFHAWIAAIISVIGFAVTLCVLPKLVKTKQDIIVLRKLVEKMHEDLLTNWTYDGKVN